MALAHTKENEPCPACAAAADKAPGTVVDCRARKVLTMSMAGPPRWSAAPPPAVQSPRTRLFYGGPVHVIGYSVLEYHADGCPCGKCGELGYVVKETRIVEQQEKKGEWKFDSGDGAYAAAAPAPTPEPSRFYTPHGEHAMLEIEESEEDASSSSGK